MDIQSTERQVGARSFDCTNSSILDQEITIRRCPACDAGNFSIVGDLNGWAMTQCSECRLSYTCMLPTAAHLQEVYNRAYTRGEMYEMHVTALEEMIRTGRSRQGFYRNRIFLKKYNPNPGDRMLEVGCGIGAFLVAAKQRGWDVEGVDISERALALSEKVHRLPVHHGTLETIDFRPQSYKAIVCWEVLEHLPNPRAFIRRVRTLLQPDGYFVCSVPNNSDRVPCFVSQLGPASLPPVHLNFWTTDSFRRFAELNGFRPLCLIPKRSLLDLAGGRRHPLRLLWSQVGALAHLHEGSTLYAVLMPTA